MFAGNSPAITENLSAATYSLPAVNFVFVPSFTPYTFDALYAGWRAQ